MPEERLPLLFWLGRNRPFRRFMKSAVKFTVMMFLLTIVCCWAWEAFLDDKVYHCVDGGPIDYLSPGDWVHAHDDQPIAVVSKIIRPHDMSGPDTIKAGWSVVLLWYTWILFFAGSVIVSILLARMSWIDTLNRLAEKGHKDPEASAIW